MNARPKASVVDGGKWSTPMLFMRQESIERSSCGQNDCLFFWCADWSWEALKLNGHPSFEDIKRQAFRCPSWSLLRSTQECTWFRRSRLRLSELRLVIILTWDRKHRPTPAKEWYSQLQRRKRQTFCAEIPHPKNVTFRLSRDPLSTWV